MLRVKLFFTRRRGADDIIQMFDDEMYLEMVRIVYTPGDHKKTSNEFHITRASAVEYVSGILRSMENDSDPFDFLQVQTAIHPTVMYSIADVSHDPTRLRIEDMVYEALRAIVEEIKLKRTVRDPVENR